MMKTIALLGFGFYAWFTLPPLPKPTIWQRVQVWYPPKGCLDTSALESWNQNRRNVVAMEHYFSTDKNLLVETGPRFQAVEVKLTGKRMVVAMGTVRENEIHFPSEKSAPRSVYKIVARTPALLFLSSERGWLDVYQNTALPPDSVTPQAIAAYRLRSARLHGLRLSYCP